MEIHPLEELFNFRFNLLYYSTAFIVLILVVEYYFKSNNTYKLQKALLPILFVLIVFLIGLRTEYVGKDTPNNIKYFTEKTVVTSMSDLKDIGLYVVSIIASSFTKNVDLFLIILAIIYTLPIYIGIRNLKLINPLIFFFFLFSFFFFKTMGINTQRQGIAFSIFFCAITYFIQDKKKTTYLLFLLAFFFHASIILPITAFLFSNRIKSLTIPMVIYALATGLAIVNFKIYDILEQVPVLNILVEERVEAYTNVEIDNYRVGFRPDFWTFNTIFLGIGFYTYQNLDKLKVNEMFYRTVLISYVLLSSFFFLMFSARFSDRFGFLAWMFIPFLLLPYVNNPKSLGVLNTITMYLICVFLATIFKIM